MSSLKKAKNLYVLVARDASTDANDNMNSITKIIEKFTFTAPEEDLKNRREQFPDSPILFPAHYMLATYWYLGEKLKEEHNLAVVFDIITDEGKNIGNQRQELTVPKGTDRLNVNVGVDGFPVDEQGIYSLRAQLVDGEDVIAEGEFPLEVAIEAQ